jgi:hypothetical protein
MGGAVEGARIESPPPPALDVAVDFAYEVANDTTKEALRAPMAKGATVILMPCQCSYFLYEVHRSHRWKVHRNHGNGVSWHPLS